MLLDKARIDLILNVHIDAKEYSRHAGIVVLTGEITNSRSARFIVAMASSRVF